MNSQQPLTGVLKIAFLLVVCMTLSVTAYSQKPKKKPAKAPAPAGSEVSNIDAAVRASLDKLIAIGDRKEAEEFFKLGQAAWKQLDVAAALENYTKALVLDADYADALRERGSVYYLIGRHEDAVRDLTAFLRSNAGTPAVLFYRAMAFSAIAKAALDAGSNESGSRELADKAYADFNAAIKQDPADALFYNGRGRLCLDFQLFPEAIADFEKAISLDPRSAAAFSNLGLAKLLTEGTGLPELDRAIAINPKFAEAYFNRANYYRARGKLDEALTDYSRAIGENDGVAHYYNGRGMVYFAKGNGVLAAKDLSSAISKKGTYAIAYLNRAMAYKQFPAAAAGPNAGLGEVITMQRQKMKSDLDAAIKYDPNLADAYVERGLMTWTGTGSELDQATLERINLARADLETAIKLDPSSSRSYGALGAIYQKLGKQEKALANYNKAVELDPRLATAYMGRMRLYCDMGKPELSIADENKVKELGLAAINICSLRK